MKCLSLIVCLIVLFLSKTLAQSPIKASRARSFVGRVVWIDDYVMKIRVISPSRVYITIGNFDPDSCFNVILSGNGAYENALRLKKRTIAEAKGHIEIINGRPWMTVTDFRRLRIPNCNCLLADEKADGIVDTVAFPNEKKLFKKPGEKRN